MIQVSDLDVLDQTAYTDKAKALARWCLLTKHEVSVSPDALKLSIFGLVFIFKL